MNTIKIEEFRREVENEVKKYSPIVYIPFVAEVIREVASGKEKMTQFPIHFLLHSIEMNGLYARGHRRQTLNKKKLHRIMSIYMNKYDPIILEGLQKEDSLALFFIMIATQQFSMQEKLGGTAYGRAIMLFSNENLPQTSFYFQEKFGLDFDDWFLIGALIQSAYLERINTSIPKNFFLENSTINKIEHITAEKINAFFKINSIHYRDLKTYHQQLADERNVSLNNIIFNDTYIQSAFSKSPLVALDDNNFIPVHDGFYETRLLEGIFDICKKEFLSSFGKEFGNSFENYVGFLLGEFLGSNILINERVLKKYVLANAKVCDYVVIADNYILCIECKALEYSALIKSPNAIQSDNSTRRISKGFSQTASIVDMIKKEVFSEIVGDYQGKQFLSIVVSYKKMYGANTEWYWNHAFADKIQEEDMLVMKNSLKYKPQLFSIRELENLLTYSQINEKSILEVFDDKLSNGDELLISEWDHYLSLESDIIPSVTKKYKEFIEEQVTK